MEWMSGGLPEEWIILSFVKKCFDKREFDFLVTTALTYSERILWSLFE